MSMAVTDRSLALKLLSLALLPVVRLCMRHGLKLQDLIDSAKVQMVHEGALELARNGIKSNASRISVMTGVHRRDVGNIEAGQLPEHSNGKDLIAKVIGQWQTDLRFLRSGGAPRVLSTQNGLKSEFARLVAAVSTDMNPASVLSELERIGAVEHRRGGVVLVKSSFVPKGEPLEGFKICVQDIDDLTAAVEHNLFNTEELPNLHARTQYDNVRPTGVEALKHWFLREGHRFQAQVREIISQHDQDLNPDASFKGRGVRVVLGMFSHVDKGERKNVSKKRRNERS